MRLFNAPLTPLLLGCIIWTPILFCVRAGEENIMLNQHFAGVVSEDGRYYLAVCLVAGGHISTEGEKHLKVPQLEFSIKERSTEYRWWCEVGLIRTLEGHKMLGIRDVVACVDTDHGVRISVQDLRLVVSKRNFESLTSAVADNVRRPAAMSKPWKDLVAAWIDERKATGNEP